MSKILVYVETCINIFHSGLDVLDYLIAITEDGKKSFIAQIDIKNYDTQVEKFRFDFWRFIEDVCGSNGQNREMILILKNVGAVCLDEEEWTNYKWVIQDFGDLMGGEVLNFEELYNKTTSKIPLALPYQEFLDKNLPKRMDNPLALIKLYDAYKQLLKNKEV